MKIRWLSPQESCSISALISCICVGVRNTLLVGRVPSRKFVDFVIQGSRSIKGSGRIGQNKCEDINSLNDVITEICHIMGLLLLFIIIIRSFTDEALGLDTACVIRLAESCCVRVCKEVRTVSALILTSLVNINALGLILIAWFCIVSRIVR